MKTHNKNLLAAALLSMAVSNANAAPIQLDLIGTVKLGSDPIFL